MKVIIAGSRGITDLRTVERAMEGALDFDEIVPSEIVSGRARGVDRLGEEWAETRGLAIKRFPALWVKHGRNAGFIRNEQMALYADALVAVWDGESRGTKHMIQFARQHGLLVHIYMVST